MADVFKDRVLPKAAHLSLLFTIVSVFMYAFVMGRVNTATSTMKNAVFADAPFRDDIIAIELLVVVIEIVLAILACMYFIRAMTSWQQRQQQRSIDGDNNNNNNNNTGTYVSMTLCFACLAMLWTVFRFFSWNCSRFSYDLTLAHFMPDPTTSITETFRLPLQAGVLVLVSLVFAMDILTLFYKTEAGVDSERLDDKYNRVVNDDDGAGSPVLSASVLKTKWVPDSRGQRRNGHTSSALDASMRSPLHSNF